MEDYNQRTLPNYANARNLKIVMNVKNLIQRLDLKQRIKQICNVQNVKCTDDAPLFALLSFIPHPHSTQFLMSLYLNLNFCVVIASHQRDSWKKLRRSLANHIR